MRSGGQERLDLAQVWQAPRPIAWRSIRAWVLALWALLFIADAALTRIGVSLLPNRKRALLMHFGTARAVKGAALEDLERAPGISKATARQLYYYFHPRG